jgi:hypothetical protein
MLGLRRSISRLRMLSMELELRWLSGEPVRPRAKGERVPVDEVEMLREERVGEKAVRRRRREVLGVRVGEPKEKRLVRVVAIVDELRLVGLVRCWLSCITW